MLSHKEILDQLIKFHNTNHRIHESADVKNLANKVYEFITIDPLIVQSIEHLEQLNNHYPSTLKIREKRVIAEFQFLSKFLEDRNAEILNPIIGNCLKIIKDPSLIIGYDHLVFQYGALRDALRAYFLHNKTSGLDHLIVDKRIDSFIKTSAVIAWETTRNDYAQRAEILNFIDLIKTNSNANSNMNALEADEMKIAINAICSFLIANLEMTIELMHIKIRSITYSFIPNDNPKKAQLTLYINHRRNKIKFSGERALLLNLILDNSTKPTELTEIYALIKNLDSSVIILESKDYDIIYRHYEAINRRIATEMLDYGITKFLLQPKNEEIIINHIYFGSIKKK